VARESETTSATIPYEWLVFCDCIFYLLLFNFSYLVFDYVFINMTKRPGHVRADC
jgi:hypothetical protein